MVVFLSCSSRGRCGRQGRAERARAARSGYYWSRAVSRGDGLAVVVVLVQVVMVRTVWAKVDGRRRLYLIDDGCDFIEPVKLYLDHLTALEKSPNTLENYCRHLCRYFTFLKREQIDWRSVKPDDLIHFIQWLRSFGTGMGSARTNESRLSERTVNTIVTAVSSLYR